MRVNVFTGAVASLLVIGTVSTALAQEYRAPNRTRVIAVNDAVFEVVPRGATRGSEYWCGASSFARKILGRNWSDRVYVARGMGPSVTTGKRSAVQFTVDPSAAGITPGPSSLSINNFVVGDSMSIQQAHQYCQRTPGRL